MGLEDFSSDDSSNTEIEHPLDGLDEDELRERLKVLRTIVVAHDADIEKLQEKNSELESRVNTLNSIVKELQENSIDENTDDDPNTSDDQETSSDDDEPLFG